jgi:nucleotide-binding universal stress UspA family protein
MASLTSILVHVDETESCPNRLAIAAGVAHRHGAKLMVAYIEPPLTLPIFFPGEVGPALAETIDAQRKAARAKADAAFATLKRDMPSAVWCPITVDDDDVFADPAVALVRAARCADLTVMGQLTAAEAGHVGPGFLPEQLVMETGRPVLVVPYAGRFRTLGERALVAWNDTREAARALADAIPFLMGSKTVTVMQACEAGARQTERARGRLSAVAEYLQRNHVTANIDLVPQSDSATVGELILSRAADLDADLLVMGAYGHSRVRELVLGGATRDILGSMTLPVLLSH